MGKGGLAGGGQYGFRSLPGVEIIVAFFVLMAACWTVLVHLAVLIGLSLADLERIYPFAIAGLVAIFIWGKFAKPFLASSDNSLATIPTNWFWPLWGVAAVALYKTLDSFTALLIASAIIFLAGLLRLSLKRSMVPADLEPPMRNRWRIAALVGLCFIAAGATLTFHRPDIDDAFYISAAADAVRHPHLPVWSTDNLYGQSHLPLTMPIYKVESYELFVALLARIFHLSSLQVAHILMPPILAATTILCWSLIGEQFRGNRWLHVTAIALAVALLAGETHRSPGNFAFVRMQQGKSFLASAIVPLLYFYGRRFMTSGNWRDWLLWAVAGIAAIGFSSSGIILEPMVAAIIVISEIISGYRLNLRMITAMGVVVYPVITALLIQHQLASMQWLLSWPPEAPATALADVLGPWQSLFFLSTLFIAWTLMKNRRSAATLWTSTGLLLLVFLDPIVGVRAAQRIFSTVAYWRIFWIVPLIIWSALSIDCLLVAATKAARHFSPAIVADLFGLLIALAALALLGWYPVWRADNGVQIGFAKLDVDPNEYSMALRTANSTPRNQFVLAPEPVASWIATLDRRPPLLFVRAAYTPSLAAYVGTEEAALRNQLGILAAQPGFTPSDLRLLDRAIARFSIGAIVLMPSTTKTVSPLLQSRGFMLENMAGYSLWYKTPRRPITNHSVNSAIRFSLLTTSPVAGFFPFP